MRTIIIHLRVSGRVDLKGDRIALLLSGASAIETAPGDEFVVQSYGSGPAAPTGVEPDRGRRDRPRGPVPLADRLCPGRGGLARDAEQGEEDRRAAVSPTEVTATTRARTFCRG